MTDRHGFIGFDIGALYLKAVRLDRDGRLSAQVYLPHKGEPEAQLSQAFDALKPEAGDTVGLTGSGADRVAETLGAARLDTTRCQRKAEAIITARFLLRSAQSTVEVGY